MIFLWRTITLTYKHMTDIELLFLYCLYECVRTLCLYIFLNINSHDFTISFIAIKFSSKYNKYFGGYFGK